MGDIVHESNIDFVASTGPTLAYLVVLMVFGLVGNTLVFLVYYNRFKPSSTRIYILVVSVCDLLTNCLALPSDIYEIRFNYDFNDESGCSFFGFITLFLNLSVATILIAIAMDRWRKVCKVTKKLRTHRNVYVELVCLGLLALGVASPLGVLKGLQTIHIPNSNVTRTTCAIDEKYAGSLFYDIYNIILFLAFTISVIIMCACYAVIARHLYLHKERLKNFTRKDTTGTYQESIQPKQEFHSFAREEQTIGTLHQQPNDSASTFTSKRSRYKEDGTASTGKLHSVNTASTFTSKRSRYKEDGTASTGKLHSVNTVVRNRAEDREDCKASAGKLQINITKNVKLDKIITAMDQLTTSYTPPTSGEMSPRLASSPKTETSSFQQEPDRFNCSTNVSRITVGDASKYHKGSTTDSRQKVHKAKKESRKITTIKVPTRTTLMMFVLTAMFVMSHVPYLIIAVLFRGKIVMIANFWEWNAYHIALRSYFFSTAINSLVYSFCSRMFRKECYLFVCRK